MIYDLNLFARSLINKCTAFALLSTLALGVATTSVADVVDIKASALTMNDELREDIHQTLSHLTYGHYIGSTLNNDFSSRILDGYLKLLDPNKIYFTQEDIKGFDKYRFKLDDLLKKRDAEVAFDIFKDYRKRMKERTELALELIDTDFDFSKEESISIDRDEFTWARSEAEIEDKWFKRIKNDTLQQVMAETPIEEIRENLERRYQRQRDVTFQLKADEVFEWFMNAYAKELGPHTQYMSDATAENFRINLSLSLQGIGAALQTEEDYTVINRIIKGGPAERSGLIKPEDKIISVAQDGEEAINVIGWRLMDVVQMIRGDKGTKVKLGVLSGDSAPGSPPEHIELVRDVIQLEDQAAKLSQVEIPDEERTRLYSVISIPSFYSNSSQELIEEMEQTDSEGLIIDLRGNGGGYLNEAISLTGLFIEQGPVVQVVPSDKKRQVLRDRNRSVAYDGPLIVMIDRYSASASEIFAAAIQDYGRAIVIGERSFGKGTVQRVAPLRYGDNVEHESQVKFTNAQFFRINGSSTQHKGVTPDIVLNSGIEDEEFGERAYENALPWSVIEAADYDSSVISRLMISDLSEGHLERSEKSPAFELLRQSSERIFENKNIKELSLNQKTRQSTRDESENESLAQLNTYRASLGLEAVTTETRKDNPLPDEDEHWNIVFHTEAAKILQDQINWSESAIANTAKEVVDQ